MVQIRSAAEQLTDEQHQRTEAAQGVSDAIADLFSQLEDFSRRRRGPAAAGAPVAS